MKKIISCALLLAAIAIATHIYYEHHPNSQNTSQQIGQQLEYPDYDETEDIVCHIGYTTSYNHQTLIPNWVAYELTCAEVEGDVPRDDNFVQDPNIRGRQADVEDYRRSGWDRGHMAPAADMKWSEQAMIESFYLSNICPQNHALNAGSWEKTEKMGRRIAQKYGSVYIVCGPIISDDCPTQTIGENKVVIPSAFFKAFLIKIDNSYSGIGFLMKNSNKKQGLKESSMTINALEEIIKRDLFPNLPDEIEESVEAKIIKKHWGI